MKEELIVSIDCGSQSMRALAFDLRGNLEAAVRQTYPHYKVPQKGWAEQAADVFWDALCTCTRKLMTRVDRARVIGVVMTSQRGSVVCLDKAGKPLRPVILWQDQRMVEQSPPVSPMWGTLFAIAGVRDTIDYLAANAEGNWLEAHQPEIWKRTDKLVLLSGWINYKLTGRLADSTGSTVGYLPFNYRKQEWCASWMWQWAATNVQPSQMLELVKPTSILGEITADAAAETGLTPGLPVVAGASDKACEVLGNGVLTPRLGSVSFGTSSSITVTSKKYMEITPFLPAYPSGVPGSYCPEYHMFRGFWLVNWFLSQFGASEARAAQGSGRTPEEHLEELAAAAPPGCRGLILQPYWAPGLRDPGPEARGAVIGFQDHHGRADLYRAVLEGLIFDLRMGKERLERKAGSMNAVRVSGGGSQSDVALQITADVFGIPAARAHTHETSGLGAAVMAAVGLGRHNSFDAAVAEMTRPGDSFEPDRNNRRIYDQLFNQVYKPLYKRLQPLYYNLKEMTD